MTSTPGDDQDPNPPGYGQQPPPYPQPYYGQPPGYPYAYSVPPRDHPRATLALVLGIVGVVLGFSCGVGFLASPFAWAIGGKAVREIDAAHGQLGGRGQAQAGWILGIVGTVFLLLAIVAVVALVAVAASGGFGQSTEPSNV